MSQTFIRKPCPSCHTNNEFGIDELRQMGAPMDAFLAICRKCRWLWRVDIGYPDFSLEDFMLPRITGGHPPKVK